MTDKTEAADMVESGWQLIDTAPLDGTVVQARIPGHGDDNMILWVPDALENEAGSCGAWAFAHEDQEPPDCWTDGWCWAVNEDGVRSSWPTHWLPSALRPTSTRT